MQHYRHHYLRGVYDPFWIIDDDLKWVKDILKWSQLNRCELPAACLVGPSRNLQSGQDFPCLQSNAWRPGRDHESPMKRAPAFSKR